MIGKRLTLRRGGGGTDTNGRLEDGPGGDPSSKRLRRVNVLKYVLLLTAMIMIGRYTRMDKDTIFAQRTTSDDDASGGSGSTTRTWTNDKDSSSSPPVNNRKPNVLYNSAVGGSVPLQAVPPGSKAPEGVFGYPDLESYEVDEADMEPIMTCSNPRVLSDEMQDMPRLTSPDDAPQEETATQRGSANKLVFVHVFKTAGSTLRAFFGEYAWQCGLGFAVIVGCSDAVVSSIGMDPDKPWRSSMGPCPLKRFTLRNGMKGVGRGGAAPNKFIHHRLDIVGGHLPLGAGVTFLEPPIQGNERPGHVRYVAFFRSALEKFVSGVKFALKSEDMDEVLNGVQRRIEQERAFGRYHAKYSKYLITPYQRREYKQRSSTDPTLTVQELTAQIMMNLIDYKVIVGITEHMSDSMELIEHFIDPTHQATNTFLKFGRNPKEGEVMPMWKEQDDDDDDDGDDDDEDDEMGEETKSLGPKMKNVSKLSTLALLEELRKNKILYQQMMEYIQYEQEIYNFALALHKKQFAAYLKKAGQGGTSTAGTQTDNGKTSDAQNDNDDDDDDDDDDDEKDSAHHDDDDDDDDGGDDHDSVEDDDDDDDDSAKKTKEDGDDDDDDDDAVDDTDDDTKTVTDDDEDDDDDDNNSNDDDDDDDDDVEEDGDDDDDDKTSEDDDDDDDDDKRNDDDDDDDVEEDGDDDDDDKTSGDDDDEDDAATSEEK